MNFLNGSAVFSPEILGLPFPLNHVQMGIGHWMALSGVVLDAHKTDLTSYLKGKRVGLEAYGYDCMLTIPGSRLRCRYLHNLLASHFRRSNERAKIMANHLWTKEPISVEDLVGFCRNFVDEMVFMCNACRR